MTTRCPQLDSPFCVPIELATTGLVLQYNAPSCLEETQDRGNAPRPGTCRGLLVYLC